VDAQLALDCRGPRGDALDLGCRQPKPARRPVLLRDERRLLVGRRGRWEREQDDD